MLLQKLESLPGNKVIHSAGDIPSGDPISPPNVVGIEGYTKLPMPDIVPPEWAQVGDPDDGLVVSNKRSCGCHQLYQLEETGKLWESKFREVAEHYKCSPRIIKRAGRMMQNIWYLLPTGKFEQFHDADPEYLIEPPVAPYNEAEQELWRREFVRCHFSGSALIMGGHGRLTSHLQYTPIRVTKDAPPLPHHWIPTVANHPWWVVPGMNSYFHSNQFKHRYFQTSRGSLFNQDRNIRPKDEFYESWEEYAPKGMGLREYSEKFEPTPVADIPVFEVNPEDV